MTICRWFYERLYIMTDVGISQHQLNCRKEEISMAESKLDFVMDVVNQEIEMRERNEMAHTNHTDYSDSYCIGID